MKNRKFLTREQILKEIKKMRKSKTKFGILKKKIAKIFPDSWMNYVPTKSFVGELFIRSSWNTEEFYSPRGIVFEGDNLLISFEKFSIGSWSSSSLNKYSESEFKKFIKIDKDYLDQKIEDLKNKYERMISELKERGEEILNKEKS